MIRDIPVPAMLEDLLGIPPTHLLIRGLFWGRDGILKWTDGRLIAPCRTDVFAAYATHPAVRPDLDRYRLGPSQRSTADWLVLYYPGRWFDVMRTKDAEPYLRHCHPPWIPFVVTEQLPPVLPDQQQIEREMLCWLDRVLASRTK